MGKNKIIFFIIALLFSVSTFGQQTIRIKILNAANKDSLPSSTILIFGKLEKFIADSNGIVELKINGQEKIKAIISYVGFKGKTIIFNAPFTNQIVEIFLELEEESEEEVIIQSTRTSRTIYNTPTRVETIELEEIDEKTNMRPNNVSMLLNESTGIKVQQTSAISGNASIRIQGLDGRYTQLLKDGFANFGNFASGLSILEIPPLDLYQVEIIKGPASTLFGGGAIAGVVNFISKTPKEKTENNIIVNQSNIGQTTGGYFFSKRNKKIGITFLGMVSNQNLYDVDKDDFTELPKSTAITLHPKLFFYINEKTTVIVGNEFSKGKRIGGDVQVIKKRGNSLHQFFEENNSIRNTTSLELQKKLSSQKSLTIKQSISIFDRQIEMPNYYFTGTNYFSFTDISFLSNFSNHSVVAGGNIFYDKSKENENSINERDNANFTAGVYIQDTWDLSEKMKLESGLRFDGTTYTNPIYSNSELFLLPRISLLIKYNNQLSSRIGAGMGYKAPTLFTEQTETMQYRNILQLNNNKSEKSYGGTADINLKSKIGNNIAVSFNQLFFYTKIDRPLLLQNSINYPDCFYFINSYQPVVSLGFETNAKFIYKDNFKLFLGYTFTDANAKYLTDNQFLPLVPKHKLNSALIYEKHEFLKIGLEGYYTGKQYLTSGLQSNDFWEFGFMAEKIWEKFSVYINFENFTNTRQSKYKPVVNGNHAFPTFDEIWTHTEGASINAGIKLRL